MFNPFLSPQVAVDMRKTFRLVLEGKASNGGFAIDQMTFNPGDCPSKIMMMVLKIFMMILKEEVFVMSMILFSLQTDLRAQHRRMFRGPKISFL